MAGRGDISAGRAFVELYVKSAQFTSQLSAMSAKWSKFGADLQAMGRTIATAGAVSLLPIGLATKRFADFDDQMRAVQAVTQASAAQLGQLTAKARQLGAETSFTAVQVGELMTELGRAGFNPGEVEAMTAAVLNLSRATGTEAKISAGIMAASLRQFSLQAGEAGRVSDALTIAANKSFNTVETLGESLSYAGPVAAQFNMSIEDTLAILGGLGNVGIQGSNAGTAVRRLLTITGAEAAKLKDIFGVNFVDAAGNARPLVDTLEEVNAATKGLGTAARAEKFSEAFGLLGITGAMAIGTSTVSIRDLRDALGNAGGAAQDAANKMDAGLGGALRILESSVEGVAIAIGDSLDAELRQLMKDFTGITNMAIHWIGQNKELVVQATKFAVALVFGGIALMGIGTALVIASSLFGVFASAAGAVMATLGIAPVVALIAVIAKLGISLWNQVGGIRLIEDAFTSLTGKASTWGASFTALFSELGTTFSETWSGITDAIAAGDLGLAADIAWAGLMAVWERGTIDIRKAWNTGIFEMESAWTDFSSVVSSIFLDAMTGWKIAWADMVHFFRSNWESFAAWFGPTWNKISSVAALALNDLREATGAITPEEAASRRETIKAGYAGTAADQAKREADAAATQKQIDDEHTKAVQDAMRTENGGRALLEEQRQQAQQALTQDYEAQVAAADKRLADAKAKLDELRGKASGKVVGQQAAGLAGLFGAGGIGGAAKAANKGPDSVEGYLASEYAAAIVGSLVPAAAAASASGGEAAKVSGAFTAAGLAALGSGGASNTPQAKLLTETEKQTDKLAGIEKATQESAAASKMLEMGLQA